MGERKFTFIELHLDGETQFGPREIGEAIPFGEKTEESELESETDDEAEAAVAEEDDGSSGKAIGALVALAALVAIAAAAKKFGGDDEPDLEEEDQPDVIVN
ncbi:hypothetical protein AB7C87_22735 [Natrarchaeobius sp. A-rgal3]|uniref:hypothetical protein n=1 Tax=Natrarchaeobius versutus TaxID=1679078 RepID=UPI00350F4EB8